MSEIYLLLSESRYFRRVRNKPVRSGPVVRILTHIPGWGEVGLAQTGRKPDLMGIRRTDGREGKWSFRPAPDNVARGAAVCCRM